LQQFFVVDPIIPALSVRTGFLTERARAEEQTVMVRPQKVHQPAIRFAPGNFPASGINL